MGRAQGPPRSLTPPDWFLYHTHCLLPPPPPLPPSPSLTSRSACASITTQEITLRSKSAAGTPAKYEWVQEAMEQLTLCKYKARPHWGKNFDRTFTHPSCRLSQRYTALPRMLTLQKQYDPLRMFEPELMTRVIKGTSSPASPECVMRRTCYCSSDAHCPRGHRCVASKAFPEYMVCKPPSFV